MEWEDFCNNLVYILDLQRYKNSTYINYNINDKKIEIKYSLEENKSVEFSYTKSKFIKDNKKINTNNQELQILNDYKYEVPVTIKNEFYFPISLKFDKIIGKKYKDEENQILYVIDRPSDEFFLKMIYLRIKQNATMLLRRLSMRIDRDTEFKDGVAKKSIFDLLKLIDRNNYTLSIEFLEKRLNLKFQDLADAFIFNMNFNTDMGIRQIYNIENIDRRRRDSAFRNESTDIITAPRRIYKKELVEQYNMASVSEDSFIKYLCYYHILEHFYEDVYNAKLIESVRKELTLPGFSIKSDKGIKRLIDNVISNVKINKEGFIGSELEALELVINKYINIEQLQQKIADIDENLVHYYDKTQIKFSGGIPVNFQDNINVVKNIAKRIYFTRNALVHYKSTELEEKEKGVYRPFNDKEELAKEIPLMRILAEEIIIENAKII